MRLPNRSLSDIEYYFSTIFPFSKNASEVAMGLKYYEDLELKRSLGDNTRMVIHNNPEDYGLTREDAIKMRLRWLRSELKIWADCHDHYLNICLLEKVGTDNWLALNKQVVICNSFVEKYQTEIDRINIVKKNNNVNPYDKIDLDVLKTVPLNIITEILPTGFFRDNPFRNESSPSNSLHWYKTTNRYKDFGSGEHGDAIDLYMAVHKCTIQRAINDLKKLC
jgi:hypothetical protein